jgi:hypothetical protein
MASSKSARDRGIMTSVAGMMSSFYGELDQSFRDGGGDEDHLYSLAAGDKKHPLARWFAQEMGRKFAALTHNPNVWAVPVGMWNGLSLPVGGGDSAKLTVEGDLNFPIPGYAALTTVEIPNLDSRQIFVRDVASFVPVELRVGANLLDAIGYNNDTIPKGWPRTLLIPGTELTSNNDNSKKFMPALINHGLGWFLGCANMDYEVPKEYRLLQQFVL